MGATSGSSHPEAIMTRMVQPTIKSAARTNTGPCGSVELHTIAAVHESLVGTKRTCRGRLTTSAPEGKTDVPREPDTSVLDPQQTWRMDAPVDH
jgi:hypothetical protein